MRAALGLVLIVVGVFVLAKPMISYTTKDKVVDLGPVEVTKEEHKHIPISPIAGGAALVAGIAVLFVGRQRTV